ncbi:MAG: glycosyl hydrolase family 95 catalytic domain-containing protein, partial [Bacteroidota bacterium]
ETVGFNGLPELPEVIANEMRSLLLVKKPWDSRSEQFQNYAYTKMPFLSRWNQKTDVGWKDGVWVHGDKGGGAFGHVTHIFSRGAKIAYQFWMEYEYTKDKQWLIERAYPMIKGVAEFYRNFPKLKKDQNGIYNIHHVNDNESVWDAKNTVEEISAMRGIFPVAIKAAEILNTDMELQKNWKEIYNNLAPLSLNTDIDDVSSNEPARWIKALPPVGRGNNSSSPDPNTMPVWFFDLCNLESENQEVMKIANSTFDSYFRNGINSETRVNVLSKLPVTGSILGRSESTRYLIPNQINTAETEVLANRMTLREGFQTTGVQRLGRMADALHLALFQSAPSEPGGKPVIRVFPAWPDNWDASFTLLGRGNFLITSSIQDNSVEFVEIKSFAGEICMVRNPWPDEIVSLYVDGKEIKSFEGELIEFSTSQKSNYILIKKGSDPKQYKREIIN